MDFTTYLRKHHVKATAERYEREVKVFLFSMESKGLNPSLAKYGDIMVYLSEQRKAKSSEVIRCGLYGIKRYYSYLIEIGQRKDHPAKTIKLKDQVSRDVQLQDLFTARELENLLERVERYEILRNRNQTILMLLIYQGLTSGELVSLEVSNIDLSGRSIYLSGGYRTKSRTLRLVPKQLGVIKSYLEVDRPQLLREESRSLLIGKLGREETGEGISYLLETLKYLFPFRKLNAQTIRQSVIANLLKEGHDLRIVQAFAGHKYPSTTERYRRKDIEALQTALERHHPLG